MEKLKLEELETEFNNGSNLNGHCPLPEPGDEGTELFGNTSLISVKVQPSNYNYDKEVNAKEHERFTRGLIYKATTGQIGIRQAGTIFKKLNEN